MTSVQSGPRTATRWSVHIFTFRAFDFVRRGSLNTCWDKFRTLSRLETKFDGTLTDYLIGYVAMCKSVLGKKISEREQAMVDDLIAVPEERAELVLDRIEMMNTIRDEVIPHPELGERLRLCDTALDLPDWWVPGRHDKDLVQVIEEEEERRKKSTSS